MDAGPRGERPPEAYPDPTGPARSPKGGVSGRPLPKRGKKPDLLRLWFLVTRITPNPEDVPSVFR